MIRTAALLLALSAASALAQGGGLAGGRLGRHLDAAPGPPHGPRSGVARRPALSFVVPVRITP